MPTPKPSEETVASVNARKISRFSVSRVQEQKTSTDEALQHQLKIDLQVAGVAAGQGHNFNTMQNGSMVNTPTELISSPIQSVPMAINGFQLIYQQQQPAPTGVPVPVGVMVPQTQVMPNGAPAQQVGHPQQQQQQIPLANMPQRHQQMVNPVQQQQQQQQPMPMQQMPPHPQQVQQPTQMMPQQPQQPAQQQQQQQPMLLQQQQQQAAQQFALATSQAQPPPQQQQQPQYLQAQPNQMHQLSPLVMGMQGMQSHQLGLSNQMSASHQLLQQQQQTLQLQSHLQQQPQQSVNAIYNQQQQPNFQVSATGQLLQQASLVGSQPGQPMQHVMQPLFNPGVAEGDVLHISYLQLFKINLFITVAEEPVSLAATHPHLLPSDIQSVSFVTGPLIKII